MRHQDAVLEDAEVKTDVKTGNKENTRTNIVELGIDLREFYKSVEWDILSVPAARYRSMTQIAVGPKDTMEESLEK